MRDYDAMLEAAVEEAVEWAAPPSPEVPSTPLRLSAPHLAPRGGGQSNWLDRGEIDLRIKLVVDMMKPWPDDAHGGIPHAAACVDRQALNTAVAIRDSAARQLSHQSPVGCPHDLHARRSLNRLSACWSQM